MQRSHLLVPALIAAAIPAWCDQQFQASGLVLEVDRVHQTITISHGSIAGFMDAMVMPFHVKDPKALDQVHPAMLVDFKLFVTKRSSYIADVRERKFESIEADPDQARRLKVLDKALQAKSGAAPTIQPGQAVADFSLTDQNHRQRSLSQFDGKVVAITFIYTRCPLPDYCFRLTNNFGRLQKRFKERMGRDLILLSITFDPNHDTPEVLAKYAGVWKADTSGWSFLTGSLADVRRVCGMFGMNFWPDEGVLTHSLHTIVLDRQRRLVANLEGNQYTANQLGDLVANVLGRPSAKARQKN
jgi:protein SCO1/2